MKNPSREVFVTGGTGYIGHRLIELLVSRGHRVRALARASSASRLPLGAEAVIGDALVAESFAGSVRPGDTIVHLIGTPHPSPAKAAEFKSVDLASILATVSAARQSKAAHIIYVSVAQPAPVMSAYLAVRAAGEAAIESSGIPATFVRPWYVLGPGHWWPIALLPIYGIASLIPSSRESARRLGLVTLGQMVRALASAVERPPAQGVRVIDVPGIRSIAHLKSRA